MNLFAKRNPEKGLRTQQIKAMIAELLELDQDVTVIVTELNCQDDDCPEVETVIAIFRPEQPKLQITLHSSIEELTDAEIERSCRNVENQSNQSEEMLLASEQHN
ncbi:MAG TPA: hypothetical protein VK638_37780 [Edaphobacter sp.]|jgi:hypothetical protein|nr:hypothetical protein [Edaphobacter sp.]